MRFLALRGLIACAFLASAAWGLDPATPLESYDAHGWGYSEGLPQTAVSAIAPSRDGYLWLGTRSGLVRFDGVRFTLVEGKSGLQALAAGADGWMWAGFLDGRLAGWRKGQRRALLEARSGEGVLSLLWSAPDTLWIGTENGLARWQGGRVEAVPVDGCGAGCRVTALARGVDGALWIGTHSNGVRRLGGAGPAALTQRDGLPDDRVESLAATRDGSLWVGTQRGLGRWLQGRMSVFFDGRVQPAGVVYSLFADDDGVLWAGTRRNLYRFRQERFEELPVRGEPFGARSIVEDSEGSLWVGTHAEGLRRLREVAFSTFDLGGRLEDVWAVYEDRERSLWLGTGDRGLLRWRGGEIMPVTTRDGLPGNWVRAILEDRSGALWIGTTEGLARRDRNGSVRAWRREDGLPDSYVRVVYEDDDGTLWIGTNGGLVRREGDRFVGLGATSGLPPGRVFAMVRDHDGALWVGAQGGLYRSPHRPPGAPGEERFELVQGGAQVFALLVDHNGTLWAGTERAGLLRFRNGRLTRFLQDDGLLNDLLLALAEDSQGRLWIGCNASIIRVREADLDAFSRRETPRIPLVAFSERDGLKNAECNGGAQPSTLVASDGRLWFPTYRGAGITDPRRALPRRRPAPVVIEEIVADGESVPFPGPQVALPPGTRKIEIRFAVLSLSAPEKVRTVYRLDGFDRAWSDAGPQRSIVYTSLAPGHYSLRISAGTEGGARSAGRVDLEVRPQLWQRPWIVAVAAALALGAFAAAWRLRLLAARRREEHLAYLVEERTRDLRLEKARAEAASQAKSEFLANMSHEIRTPLNAVLGLTGLVLRSSLTDPQREHLETARQSGEALLTVINGILDMAKIEAGGIEIEIAPFDLRDCMMGALRLVESKALAKGLALRCQIGEEVPTGIESDAGRLRQILINLLDNAVKFTERGEVSLEAAASAIAADGSQELRITVRDTGIGIPPAALGRLFQPFAQVDASTSRRHGGTGLGLVISRRLAEMLGGSLEVESEPGRGSAFLLTLRCRPAHVAPAPGGEPEILALAEAFPLRILLAEDNAVNQQVGMLMLERMGYRADAVSDGHEVLAALHRQRYDLVLMDLQMPRMDGLEATRRLRAELPPDHQPRVVALTANVLSEQREICFAAGMDDFVTKPVGLADLQAMILRMKGEAPDAEPPVDPEHLDLRRLEDLRSLGDQTGHPVLFEILESFLADFPRRLEQMREALARADARNLALVAHTLKGSSAQLGLTRVSALSFEVERGARADLSRVPSLLSALENELARVAPLLTERREREGLRRG